MLDLRMFVIETPLHLEDEALLRLARFLSRMQVCVPDISRHRA